MDTMMQFLEARIAACFQRAQALEADFRKDEAVFEKVRENVYDILKTVLAVAVKQHSGDDEAARLFFESRMTQLSAAWQQALEKAQQHGNENKVLIESIKLEALADIRAAYTQGREENV